MVVEKQQKKNYIMSVVMPVHNSELFLCEAVDSVINQTLGFEDNIQLIFINDASTDNSRELCQNYLKQYPDNIIYHELETNSGVSVARNTGIDFVEGEFVAFFDSDDIWPEDAFEKAYQFFCEHNDEIDVISCRMRFFGYKDGYFEGVDRKFQSGVDRVVDLEKEYTALHHGVSSSFIRGTCVKSLRFDSTLSSGDDSKFLNTVILRKLKYGLLASVEYMYRKHSRLSVVSKRYRTKKYYTDIDRTLQYFIDLSNEQYGRVVRFIQHLMAYNIGVRLYHPIDTTVLNEKEIEEYKGKIKKYLSFIDDEVIVQTAQMHRAYKVYALGLKHDDLNQELRMQDGVIYYKDTPVFDPRSISTLRIIALDVEGNTLKLFGSFDFKLPIDEKNFYFATSKKKYRVRFDQFHANIRALGDTIYTRKGFSVEIPITEVTKINAKIDYLGTTATLRMMLSDMFPIGNFRHSYYHKEGLLITRKADALIARPERKCAKYEIKYLGNLLYRRKIGIACLRLLVLFRRWFLRMRQKEIWLFADRIAMADDNGEFFYDYVQKKNNPKIESYYIIAENSKDLDRIKHKKGNYVIYKSFKYELLCLLAKYCLTSTRRLPPGKYHDYFKDMRFETIYLKHGIDGTDVSKFVNRLEVNDRVYLSSTKGEYDACINGNYGLTEREVKLTGLARHDLLYGIKSESKRIICLAPTWRMYLAAPIDLETQERAYDAYFKSSEFYKFFNSLINDERLLEAMRSHNYTGVLQLHPNLIKQSDDFVTNDVFSMQDTSNKRFVEKYQGVDLVLTDYSSIAFEYALMGKSVIYAQFDREKFFLTQYYEGEFDFEKDGFGPVCYNLEDTVNALIKAIENDCKMDEIYKKRCEEYFPPFDGKNCDRIYDMVMEL